jgi:hypothetical protein
MKYLITFFVVHLVMWNVLFAHAKSDQALMIVFAISVAYILGAFQGVILSTAISLSLFNKKKLF